MIDTLKKELKNYEIKPITKDNFHEVMNVYDSNSEFFMLTEGKSADYEDSLERIDQVPKGYSPLDKVFVGLWDKDQVVGVLDFLHGYPEKDCLWIGLFLVHGDIHRKGFGSVIIQALKDSAKTKGYRQIQLGVIENNIKGLKFWRKIGFEQIRVSASEIGEKKVIVMQYLLDTSE